VTRDIGWRTLTTMMTDGSGLEKLLVACQNGDISQVRRLLKDPRIRRKDLIDINLNVENRPFQGTALTAAAGSGDSDVVKALLSLRKDLDPNVKDGFGRSPYYYALKGNHTEVMRLLNNDPRHQISTVTEAMLECPLESVDPPLPNTQMAVQPVKNKKGNKGTVIPFSFTSYPPSADFSTTESTLSGEPYDSSYICQLEFPPGTTDQQMEEYIKTNQF